MKSFLRLIVIIILNSQLSILNSSCTQDGYDKGEGQYSYLRGDFVEAYMAGQIAKITLDNKDEAFLRERILTMYSNPAINKGKSEQ